MILRKQTVKMFSLTLGVALNFEVQAKQIQLDYQFLNPSGSGAFQGLVSSESSSSQLEFITPAVEFGGIRGDLTIAKTDLWFDVNPYPAGRPDPYPPINVVPQFVVGMDMSFSSYNSLTAGQYYQGEVSPPANYQALVQLNFAFDSFDYPGQWVFNAASSKFEFDPTRDIYQYHIQATADTPRFTYERMQSTGVGLTNDPFQLPSWLYQDLVTTNQMSTKSQGLFINLSAYKPVTPQGEYALDILPDVAIVPFTVPDPGLHNLPYPTDGPGAVSARLEGTLRNYQIYSDPRATGNSFSNPAEETIVIEQGDNAYNNLEFTNEGVIDNEDVLTNWNSAKLINRNLIQNNGQIINYGLLENNNSASVFNEGLLSNQEAAQFKQHGGSFQNGAVAELRNAGDTIFDQNAVLINEGFISQKGGQKFALESGATLENKISGLLDNFGQMVIGDLAVIRNEGRYVGNGNSDLLIDKGKFVNDGLINLAGTPVLGVPASPRIIVVNDGSLLNNAGKQISGGAGTIWLKDGGSFLNRGDVNVGTLLLSSANANRDTIFLNGPAGNFTGKILLAGQGAQFQNSSSMTLINESQMTNKSLLTLGANGFLKVDANASLLLASDAKIDGVDRTNSRLENLGIVDIGNSATFSGVNLHNLATIRISGAMTLDKGIFNNDSALVMNENSTLSLGVDQTMNVGSLGGATGLVQALDSSTEVNNKGSFNLLKGTYVSQGRFLNRGNFLLDTAAIFDGNFKQLNGSSNIEGKMLKEVIVDGGNLLITGAEFGNKLNVRSFALPASVTFGGMTASSVAADMTVGQGGKVHVEPGATVTVGGEAWDSGKVFLEGNLQVGAANGGFFYLNQDGQLGGPGKITLLNQGKVIMNGGSIVPGDPVTFTIDGDLEVNQGTLDIQIAGPGDHDVINVTGNTVINGGTVKFNYMNDYFEAPSANPDVAWLSAGGNVTGVENLHQLFAYTQSIGQLRVIDPRYDYLIAVTGGVVNELPRYTNTAAIETRAGGELNNQAGGMLFNDEMGVITNQDGGTLNNSGFDSVLFNAGSLRNTGAGTTLNNTGSITNLGSIVNQAGATFNNGDTLSNAAFSLLENRGEIQNSGQFSNAGGADLANRGLFKNNGTVVIAANSFIEGEGRYIQESGETRVDGMLVQTGTEILGGKIGGAGTVNGNLIVDGATIDLGTTDTFTVNGDLVLNEGLLNFSMAGPDQHSVLNLNGHGSFSGGIIKIDFANGYIPNNDDFTTYLYAANGLDGIETMQFQFTGLSNRMTLDFLQDANSLSWRAVNLASVPLPASAWLMASALAGLVCMGGTRKPMPVSV